MRVLDIGCGANLIYPLLGAAMHGWRFVGVDITDAAMHWAARNAAANPHLQHLLEIRRVPSEGLEAAGVEASPQYINNGGFVSIKEECFRTHPHDSLQIANSREHAQPHLPSQVKSYQAAGSMTKRISPNRYP